MEELAKENYLDPAPLTPAEIGGFSASAVACDIRGQGDQRRDLALLFADRPCITAGTFTQNRLAAAPVHLCKRVLGGTTAPRAVVMNSGNANACTGPRGAEDARAMQEETARCCGIRPGEVLVCSTGRIGEPLPMERIREGIREAAKQLASGRLQGEAAADAILTSDTCRKIVSATVPLSGGTIHLSGMAKGAGMIEPNMATMLAFLTTDAAVEQAFLRKVLGEAVGKSFNTITVDGDESTNDTVLFLASGASGVSLSPASGDADRFRSAVEAICRDLADMIVGDGERVTKVVEVLIQGAADEADAEAAARAIGNSLLVKASWYGNDPNWGRVLDALGYSGAELSEDTVMLAYAEAGGESEIPVFTRGHCHAERKADWKRIVAESRFRLLVHLGRGEATSRLLATDLSVGYVEFNKAE